MITWLFFTSPFASRYSEIEMCQVIKLCAHLYGAAIFLVQRTFRPGAK
jgi:hypothetical protein